MDSEELHELIAVQVRDVGLVDGDTACVVTDMILMALHGAGYEIQQKTASSGEILGSDAGSEKVAGGSTREDGRVEGVLVASSGCTPEALVTPATDPAPVCEWVHSGEKTTSSCMREGVTNWMWNGRFQDKCPNCWNHIKFTEAQR